MTPTQELELFEFPTRAAIYIRVSHQEQVLNGRSLENQKERLESYAHSRGYKVVLSEADEARSGRTMNRPAFQKLLQAAKEHKYDVLIVYSLSRFARNTVDTLEAVRLLRENNVQFISLSESIDTTSAMGSFFLTMLAAFAQLEAETASERIKAIMDMKKAKGEHTGQTPYGFRKDGTKLVEDEAEQKIIREVLRMRRDNYSISEIARQLTKKKFATRSGKTTWQKTQVARILQRNEK